jgi:hypothetical protein
VGVRVSRPAGFDPPMGVKVGLPAETHGFKLVVSQT